jgi:hypothetical protein
MTLREIGLGKNKKYRDAMEWASQQRPKEILKKWPIHSESSESEENFGCMHYHILDDSIGIHVLHGNIEIPCSCLRSLYSAIGELMGY